MGLPVLHAAWSQNAAKGETAMRIAILYQPPYPVTALAQVRCVMEARRSGVFISLFQAAQQASTMAP